MPQSSATQDACLLQECPTCGHVGTLPWPTCVRCGYTGPQAIQRTDNVHLFRMDCAHCHRYIQWLGRSGPDWLARLAHDTGRAVAQ